MNLCQFQRNNGRTYFMFCDSSSRIVENDFGTEYIEVNLFIQNLTINGVLINKAWKGLKNYFE